MEGRVHWGVYVLAAPMALVFTAFILLITLSDTVKSRDNARFAWEFVDRRGEPQFNTQFEEATSFSNGLAAVRTDEGWGYINRQGDWVIPAQFGRARPCGVKLCPVGEGRLWGLVDHTGRVVTEPHLFRVGDSLQGWTAAAVRLQRTGIRFGGSSRSVDLSWGLLASDGSWKRPPDEELEGHARIVRLAAGDSGWAVTYADGRSGFLDAEGRVILGTFEATLPFFEQRAAVKHYGRWGVIDEGGRWVVDANLLDAKGGFNNGRIVMSDRDGATVLTRDGTVVASGYDRIERYSDGLAAARRVTKWGFVDGDGRWVIEPTFRSVEEPFNDGLAVVRREDGRRVFVSAEGTTVGDYVDAGSFADGVAPVRVDRR